MAEHPPRTLSSGPTPLYLRLGELRGLRHIWMVPTPAAMAVSLNRTPHKRLPQATANPGMAQCLSTALGQLNHGALSIRKSAGGSRTENWL